MCSDIRIMFITPTPSVPGQIFHPSLSAHAKTYHYTVSVGPRHDPTQYRWVWHVGEQLDLDLVRSACQVLQSGSHDFAAFQGAPRGSDDKRKRENQSTVCTIDCISIEPVSVWLDTTTYTISVTGDRFLYKQIRFLVGALVAVGTDKLQVSAIEEMLLTGTREGQTPFECAPAHGLSLHEVHYDIPIRWAGATM
jgi:tRNA pseudouridine38-40 synthase